MAASVTDPGGTRSLCTLTANDEADVAWVLANAEGDVGRMRSGALERGGSFSTVDYDKMTDRQMRAARRQSRIFQIRTLMSIELWAVLARYWSPECARVRVERARSKPGADDSLAPLSAADRELRIVALYPYTPAAQAAGEKMAVESRLKERSRRVQASHLRVVGTPGEEEAAGEPTDASEGNVDDALAPIKVKLADGSVVEMSADESQAAMEFALQGQGLGQVIRLNAAAAEWQRRRVNGPWTPRPLAADELRDWAVRAIRDAERRKDVVLLSDIRVQAVQAYALAQDAYVRARRVVKGKDGEEKRAEAAERWRRVNVDQRTTEDRSGFIDALESSSRIRSA